MRQPCNNDDCQLKPKYLVFKSFKVRKEKSEKEILVHVIRTKSFKFYVDFKMNLAMFEKDKGVKRAQLSDFG